jgi:DNA polymerase III delta subunit
MNSVGVKNGVRLYFIAGDDSVGREQARAAILRNIGSIHDRYVIEKFDSSSEQFAAYLAKMFTASLFQDIRVFHINHCQLLGDGDLEELDKALNFQIPDDIFIIIEFDEVKKGKESENKAAKKLHVKKRCTAKDASCSYQEFFKPPEYKTPQWIMQQVPLLFGRKIDKADAEYLVELAGSDIDILYSELQKIDIHLEKGAPVRKDAIELVVGVSRQMNVFELGSALSFKDFTRSLKIINSLFETSFYPPVMVSALFRHFWALFRIKKFEEKNPQQIKRFLSSRGFNDPEQNETGFAIGRAAGLLKDGEQHKVYPVIILPKIVAQARNFSFEELKTIFRWLLEFDSGVKTGKIDASQYAVQMLCFKIVRVSELIKDGTDL